MLELFLSQQIAPILSALVAGLGVHLNHRLRLKKESNTLASQELEYLESMRLQVTKAFNEERDILRRTFEQERQVNLERLQMSERSENELRKRVEQLENECDHINAQLQQMLLVVQAKDRQISELTHKLHSYHEALLTSKRSEQDLRSQLES